MDLKEDLVARHISPAVQIIVTMDAVTKPEESTCTIMGVSPPPSFRTVFKVFSFNSKILLLDGPISQIRISDPDLIVVYEIQAS